MLGNFALDDALERSRTKCKIVLQSTATCGKQVQKK